MSNFVFNPGGMNYQKIINYKYYIDKTDLIFELNERINTPDQYICVTRPRPRRFGKTVTADMLSAYYNLCIIEESNTSNDKTKKTDKENKTEGEKTKILKYLKEFNVIQLTMHDYFSQGTIDNGIEKIKRDIIEEAETNDLKSIEEYLDFLNIILKDKKYIALVYMTGILPLKKIGFTDEEVQKLCKKFIKNQHENSKKRKGNDGMVKVKDSSNNNISSSNDKDDAPIHINGFENSSEKESNPEEINYEI
ncbi:hypothetical protein PIROE2DRAFT_19252 [Piromyces sp. E2]|nr:hypothetical protein PIROE2DRAFT_19252 [Piromyces sp. E2]|eukprot:OUM56228.1 hypothetical protein PIROE2DRAFT_19252 [Piromyces sp. E2]